MMDKTEIASPTRKWLDKSWYIHSMWSLQNKDKLYTVISSEIYYIKISVTEKKTGCRKKENRIHFFRQTLIAHQLPGCTLNAE